MDIDFTRLRYFVAVADELHFKRAADKLMITPPPLSKQIRLLEKELGGALFERGYHEVRLSPLGARLVGPAREILRQVEAFKAAAGVEVRGHAPIRVNATAYAPSDLLGQLEAALARLSAATEFSVPGSAAEVTAKLIAGHAELGLIHLPATDRRLRHKVVASYQGGIAVRFDDPLATRKLVAIEELRDREVAIDFARPNPVVLAGLTRRLNRKGCSASCEPPTSGAAKWRWRPRSSTGIWSPWSATHPSRSSGGSSPRRSSRSSRSTRAPGRPQRSRWPGCPTGYTSGSLKSRRSSIRSPHGWSQCTGAPDPGHDPAAPRRSSQVCAASSASSIDLKRISSRSASSRTTVRSGSTR